MLYLTALQEGLLYGLLALGVYISLRVLDIPDLTTEGSFGFGSALAAVLAAGGHTYLSLPIAFLGGMAAGLITGLLQTKLQVHPVLAGIITMSGLYSVNLIVRGGPNLSIGAANLFKQFYKAGIYSAISEEVIRPSAEECARNSRARSTKMRWAIRAQED